MFLYRLMNAMQKLSLTTLVKLLSWAVMGSWAFQACLADANSLNFWCGVLLRRSTFKIIADIFISERSRFWVQSSKRWNTCSVWILILRKEKRVQWENERKAKNIKKKRKKGDSLLLHSKFQAWPSLLGGSQTCVQNWYKKVKSHSGLISYTRILF